MRATQHIDEFIKSAEAAMFSPYGAGGAQRASGGYNRRKQEYSQPQPPTDATNPSLTSSQQSIEPPSV